MFNSQLNTYAANLQTLATYIIVSDVFTGMKTGVNMSLIQLFPHSFNKC